MPVDSGHHHLAPPPPPAAANCSCPARRREGVFQTVKDIVAGCPAIMRVSSSSSRCMPAILLAGW